MFSFSNGVVPTAANLNEAIGPTFAVGTVKITPVANTVTQKRVTFPAAFAALPHVYLTPASTVAGSTLKGWSARSLETTGFTAAIYRTNTTDTYLNWVAALSPIPFTAGQPAYASLLNQGAGGMVTQAGAVSITPTTAGVPESSPITFPVSFLATPTVLTTAISSVPSQILGTGVTSAKPSGCDIWLCRGSTTTTQVAWIAVGRL